MKGNLEPADARRELEVWLRETLPADWVDLVDNGRPPGSLSLYPDFDVDEWLDQLFGRRYLMSAWPAEYGGLSARPEATAAMYEELGRYDVPLPLWVSPLLMCGGALLQCGTEDQRAEFLPNMASGKELWCQLFSEPNAGSDLASLRTTATKDDGTWVMEGQKVWTTFAHRASWGMLLARSDRSVPHQKGITAFVVDMASPGVDVRPLRQITGDASFNEVFLDGVVVPDSRRIGPVHNGWEVTRSMLEHERGILSLQRVGGIDIFRLLDRHRGCANAITRQQLVQAYTKFRLTRMAAWRGYGEGVEAQVTKLLQTESNRSMQELALTAEGMRGVAFETGDADRAEIAYGFLRSRANTIAGGTSEVMRNIIGERLLGLPREPHAEAAGRN